MTFLVFFSAAAGAWIVASDLLRIATRLLGLLLLRRSAGMRLHQALLIAAALLFHPVHVTIVRDSNRIHLLHDIGLEATEHLRENIEALTLILLKRVSLAISAQSDALLEMIHRQEVLLPVLVE